MLSKAHVVLVGHIFVGLNIDEYIIVFIVCVGVRFPCDFLGADGAHAASDGAGPVNRNTALDMWRNFGRYGYQLVEKPGWV